MPQRFTVVALVALLALSCGGGGPSSPSSPSSPSATSPPSPTPQPSNTSFSAVVDGVAFVPTAVIARVVDSPGHPEESYLEVHGGLGSSVNGTQLSIAVRPRVGTWTATPIGTDGGASGAVAVTVNSVSTSYATVVKGGSGWVTVASINATGASGTFAFVAPPFEGGGASKSVTNGTFNVTF